MPGTAEEHKRQETPTINAIDRQPTPSQTKHQALSKGRPGIRTTPINTAAGHASAHQQPAISTLTQQGHHQILSANTRCEA